LVLETAGPSCHGAGWRRTEQEGRMQCEEDWLVMHALFAQHGWSISKIAREFGVDWRTARRYATAEAVPRYRSRTRPAELTEAQAAYLERRLHRCHGLRATTLYRELQELGYEGSYPSLVRRVRAVRPRDVDLDPTVRFETEPGVQVQVDWTDCGSWLLGSELRRLHALVEILGYSRMVAVRFATDTTRPTTLRLLVAGLEELGGAPAEVLSDRDPALVIGQTPQHRPVFAPEWSDLAASLGTKPKACRPHRAKTKGKVERAIRELKEDFLRWLTGQVLPAQPSIADYDRLARRWAREVVAQRRHRTTGRVISEAWEQERAMLREIPPRIVSGLAGERADAPARVIDLSALRLAGDVVAERALGDYEAVIP
jgi:transposase